MTFDGKQSGRGPRGHGGGSLGGPLVGAPDAASEGEASLDEPLTVPIIAAPPPSLYGTPSAYGAPPAYGGPPPHTVSPNYIPAPEYLAAPTPPATPTTPAATAVAYDNPWFPPAIVSLFLPCLGLIWVPGQRRVGFVSFGFVVASIVVLSILMFAFEPSISFVSEGFMTLPVVRGSPGLFQFFGTVRSLFGIFAMAFGLIYTRDAAVRASPALGAPLVFRAPLALLEKFREPG